ncbi:Y-family DNA polymerase [Vibrio parahaemolyticus]|nr:Y-family DNA polymerase [Vibrio parahaemolyticus]
MYCLVDANAFYASCEAVFRPDLRQKGQLAPIIVLSNNDGCIVAMNNSAKRIGEKFGIKKFDPFLKHQRAIETLGINVFSSNYELYASISERMMQTIGRFSPDHHIYSIDEQFLCFDSFPNLDPQRVGEEIRKTVWRECRIPVSVGFGDTLTLAKLANRWAKNEPSGVFRIGKSENMRKTLIESNCDQIWGIGSKYTQRLKFEGITNALQLSEAPFSDLRRTYNIEIERIARELNGERCRSYDEIRADKKQIFSSRTLGEKIFSKESLCEALSKHAHIASRKLREQQSRCKTIIAFASSSLYDRDAYSAKFIHRFESPTSDLTRITKVINQNIDQLFSDRVAFSKVGVGLVDILSEKGLQLDLLESNPDKSSLMSIIDKTNLKFGSNTLTLGSFGREREWEMKRLFLSPRFTTRWRDLPQISC